MLSLLWGQYCHHYVVAAIARNYGFEIPGSAIFSGKEVVCNKIVIDAFDLLLPGNDSLDGADYMCRRRFSGAYSLSISLDGMARDNDRHCCPYEGVSLASRLCAPSRVISRLCF